MNRYFNLQVIITCSAILFLSSCSSGGDKLPPPADVKQVQELVKGKKLKTQKTGFYSNLTVNGKRDVEWADAGKEENKVIRDAINEEKQFALQFTNDSTVLVYAKDTTYSGTYKIDNETGQYDEGQEGVKLRISYVDPSFKFGTMEPSEVTFTYLVAGADKKSLLLELPRTINRRKLVSLLGE